MSLLSIVVLNYNRIDYTKQTISNLIKKTRVKHEFIFVDNGSTDGTRRYLDYLRPNTNAVRVTYVFNKYNFGVAGGRNSGLVHARGDYLMTIDDDVLVPDDYDKKLIEACDKIENLGITGINVEKRPYPIKRMSGVRMQAKNGNLGGACLCIPRKIFRKTGFFSPDFIYGGEDTDMYIRMQYLKLKSAYIEPMGKHLHEIGSDKYIDFKGQAHSAESPQVKSVTYHMMQYIKRNHAYVPYRVPNRFKDRI